MANIPPDPPGDKAPKAGRALPKISRAPKPPPPLLGGWRIARPEFKLPVVEFDYEARVPPDACAQTKLAILAAVGMDPMAGIVHVLRAYIGVARALGGKGLWSLHDCEREIDRFLQFLASSQQLVEGIYSAPRAEVKTALGAMQEYRALLRVFARKAKRPQDTPAPQPVPAVRPGRHRKRSGTLEPVSRKGYRQEVAQYKQKKGFTNAQAARALGVDETVLKSIMSDRGRLRCSEATLKAVREKIAKALTKLSVT
jgi:hypothetical protein